MSKRFQVQGQPISKCLSAGLFRVGGQTTFDSTFVAVPDSPSDPNVIVGTRFWGGCILDDFRVLHRPLSGGSPVMSYSPLGNTGPAITSGTEFLFPTDNILVGIRVHYRRFLYSTPNFAPSVVRIVLMFKPQQNVLNGEENNVNFADYLIQTVMYSDPSACSNNARGPAEETRFLAPNCHAITGLIVNTAGYPAGYDVKYSKICP
jgi:hypothetical protein